MKVSAGACLQTEFAGQNRQTANLLGWLHAVDHLQRMATGSGKIGDQLASLTTSKVVLPRVRQADQGARLQQGINGLRQRRPMLFDITQLARAEPLAKGFGAVLDVTGAHQELGEVRAGRSVATVTQLLLHGPRTLECT